MTPNAPHEGASGIAAKLPLDAVVGGAVSPEPTFEQGDKA